MSDIDTFAEKISKFRKSPVSRQDANEAFHNLSGFMDLLNKINEREQVISTRIVKTEHAN